MNVPASGRPLGNPGLDDDQVGAKRGRFRHGLFLPRVPGGVAGDDDDAPALVLAEERSKVARCVAKLERDRIGEDVRRPVQRVAGGDVRFGNELEDEDRAG